MFEERMSSNELLDEYRLDLPDIQAKTLNFVKSEYMTKQLRKCRKQQSVIVTKIFTSFRANSYLGILIYYQTGVGKAKRWDWSVFHIGLMDTEKGVAAIAFYTASKQAIKFNPHFFSRYKERFLDVCDWQTRNRLSTAKSLIDVIGIYMQRNLTMTWIETKSVFRNKVHIFGPINDGVALLQWNKHRKLLQANTFVTLNMLDEKQTEMVKYARIYISLSKVQRRKFRFPDFISND